MHRRMTPEDELPSKPPKAFRLSKQWDIYVPIAIATVPAGIFALLGFVTEGLDKPGAKPSTWVIVAMILLQTLGIIAMAFVVLTRLELGLRQLSLRTHDRPPVWRKLILLLSIVCILLFDILTNVAAAFAGAGPLIVLAIPVFFTYLLCVRVAFTGL